MIRYRQGGWPEVHFSVYSALKGKVKRKCLRKRRMHLKGQHAAWNELPNARVRRGLLSIVIAAEEVDKCLRVRLGCHSRCSGDISDEL